jgi:ParB family chromosome partitioning protein
MSRLGNNPLLKRTKSLLEDEQKIEKVVKQFGRMVNLSKSLIENIDFEDKEYINRLYETHVQLETEELQKSIEEIGLLNIIYLQEKEAGKFRIVSGLRRLTACREIYAQEKDVKGRDRVVIFSPETPVDMLDLISVDENTKRKNLTILEQSYKFNKEAKKKNKKIDDILEEYNISKKSFYRIKNAINYPVELKEVIEEVGVDKAEILNKIIQLSDSNAKQILDEYKDITRDDLRVILKDLQKNIKKEIVKIKHGRNSLDFKINTKISTELKNYFEKIKKMIDNDDYSFISKL